MTQRLSYNTDVYKETFEMKVANINVNKLVAEFVGTFMLTFAVLASINGFLTGVATPVVAGFVLFLSVLAVGLVSGSHINPAVTAAMFSIKQIDAKHAVSYIVVQLVAGFAALSAMQGLVSGADVLVLEASQPWDSTVALAEAFGALVFGFGIAAAVANKYKDVTLAALIGGSLTIGIVFAIAAGSLGVLNPAVALGLDVFNWSYVVGPIVGAVVGANLYNYLVAAKK